MKIEVNEATVVFKPIEFKIKVETRQELEALADRLMIAYGDILDYSYDSETNDEIIEDIKEYLEDIEN